MRSKKLGIIALLLVLVLSMTACTESSGLARAFKKQAELSHVKGQTKLSFDLSAEGLSEENMGMFAMLEELVNGLELTIDQKSVRTEDSKQVKGKLYLTMKSKGQVNKASIWVDLDARDEKNPKLREIFQLPKSLMGIMGKPDKDYLVYDMSDLGEITNQAMDKNSLNKITEWAARSQDSYLNIFSDLYRSEDLKLDLVKNLGKQTIKGEVLDSYEVRLSDGELKQLIRYTVNRLMKNEDFNKLNQEYMDLVKELVVKAGDGEEVGQEFDKLKDSEKILAELNRLLDRLDGLTILGKDGLVIKYGVNKDGYIVSETGSLDLLVKLDQISGLMPEEMKLKSENMKDMKGSIGLKIKFDTSLTHINDRNLKVELPRVNEANSINLIEEMKKQEEKMLELQKELEASQNLK